MVPVSFAVFLLQYFGILQIVSRSLNPLFAVIGLPGAAALASVTAMLLNIYSAIAVIGTLTLTARQISILAVLCLVAHNLIVETAVQRRTGTHPVRMLALRIGGGLLLAFVLNLVLPGARGVDGGEAIAAGPVSTTDAFSPFLPSLADWGAGALFTVVRVVLIVTVLMVGQRLLDEFGVTRLLARYAGPVVQVFGLPKNTAFLWIVANTLGLAYGGAVMIGEKEAGALPREDADLLNHHLGVSHSLLEDTLLFVAIGVGVGVLILPRLALAFAAVWIHRGELMLRRRSRT
jgi:spore maturation protein SpmB